MNRHVSGMLNPIAGLAVLVSVAYILFHDHPVDTVVGPADRECVTFSAFYEAPDTGQFIRAGETALCGSEMGWTATFGPDIETYIEVQRGQIIAWRDCVSYGLCSDALKDMIVDDRREAGYE